MSSKSDQQPLRLFYSYSHHDERFRKRLETELVLLQKEGFITAWHDRMIGAGEEWKASIDEHLENSQIILLLISSDFIASDYCYDIETRRALEKHEAGEARVVPIILRTTDNWTSTPVGKLQALPTDGKAITGRGWHNQDEAWAAVVKGIRKVAMEMKSLEGKPVATVVKPLFAPPRDTTDRVTEPDSLTAQTVTEVLPTRITAINGYENVASVAVQLLQHALKVQSHEQPICLTSQSTRDITEGSASYATWQLVLREVLKTGWDVQHLWRLDQTAKRSIQLVENIKNLLGTEGTYQVRYFMHHGALIPSYDLMIVPTIGALSMYSTENAETIDAAIYMPYLDQSREIDILGKHFWLLSEHANNLFRSHHPNQSNRRTGALFTDFADIYCKEGDLFRIKDGLSETTRPKTFYTSNATYLRAIRVTDQRDPVGIQSSQERAKKRWKSFEHQIQTYMYYDICPRNAVIRLVNTGELSKDEQSARPGYVATPSDRLAWIKNTITLLNDYDNYKLALIDDEEQTAFFQGQWLVKGEEGVFIETWCSDGTEADLIITEPTIARVFQAYAKELWERIKEDHRNKRKVIKWLEYQQARIPAE